VYIESGRNLPRLKWLWVSISDSVTVFTNSTCSALLLVWAAALRQNACCASAGNCEKIAGGHLPKSFESLARVQLHGLQMGHLGPSFTSMPHLQQIGVTYVYMHGAARGGRACMPMHTCMRSVIFGASGPHRMRDYFKRLLPHLSVMYTCMPAKACNVSAGARACMVRAHLMYRSTLVPSCMHGVDRILMSHGLQESKNKNMHA